MPIAASRISHINVNCADLEHSTTFYRDRLGLTPLVRTTPSEPQPGAAFGLDQVQWDAWILRGDSADRTVVLDLLEWIVPPPVGAPATDATATGFNRLAISTPDLEATHARLVDAGVDCWSPPHPLQLDGGGSAQILVCSDPDGTQIELVQGDDTGLSHVTVNCADFERSLTYYQQVMGLEVVRQAVLPRQPGTPFRIEGDIELRIALLRDSESGFMIELVDWITPRVRPTTAPTTNQLGIFRLAWVTGDIDADHASLADLGVTTFSPPADVEMGPGVPNLRAIFWGDPDGACLEIIQPGTDSTPPSHR